MNDKPWDYVRVSDVEAQDVEWMLTRLIPYGFVTGVAGPKRAGKSTLLNDMAARQTTTGIMPSFGNDPAHRVEPGCVIWFSAEDHVRAMLKKRLMAAGADMDFVCLPVNELPLSADEYPDLVTAIDGKIHKLRALVRKVERDAGRPVKMIVFDPISSFAGAKNTKSEQGVRQLLEPLSKLAADLGIAIINVMHLTKTGKSAVDRVMGGAAMTNITRSFLFVGKNLEPDEPNMRFVMLHEPSLVPYDPERQSVAFELSDADGQPTVDWRRDWQEVDLEAVISGRGPSRPKMDEAKVLIERALANKPMAAEEMKELGKRAGISWATMRAAKKPLGVKSDKRADGWYWRSPSTPIKRQARPSALKIVD